ncbi:hypothetical protein [Gorillibacterium massiliense]|uniref:hypothetical protein n=1 Tax=Gorillibacterium massiliense TaxID=1280390 RepID=UPI0004AC823C|nr:hypothetical protein [Gorillibacterium massiliense]
MDSRELFAEWNEKMQAVKEKERNHEKWKSRFTQLNRELQRAEEKLERTSRRLEAENEDVEKLKRLSLSNFILTLIHKKDDRLEQEQLEAIAAKAEYDAAYKEHESIGEELAKLRTDENGTDDWKMEYDRLMIAKEQLLKEHSPAVASQLADLAENKGKVRQLSKELQEAAKAGRTVLADLNSAIESLSSAKDWGTYDMLGGGAIATYAKRSRIDDAMNNLAHARQSMRDFQKELKDVQLQLTVDLSTGEYLRFSDYFFDGFITDWMVQKRIDNNLDQIEGNAAEIRRLVGQLDEQKNRADRDLESMERQTTSLIENAN